MKPGVGAGAAKPSDGRTAARRTIPALRSEHYEAHRKAFNTFDTNTGLLLGTAQALMHAADVLRNTLADEMPKCAAAADLRPGDLVEVWWPNVAFDVGHRFRVATVEALDDGETRITGPSGVAYDTEDLLAVYLLDRPVDKKTLLLQEAATELANIRHTPNAVDTTLERLTELVRKLEQLETTEGHA